MSLIPFSELPGDSRLFIFTAERALPTAELALLSDALTAFLTDWTAHRKELTVGADILHERFILIGVDESKLPPSGCSIDSLMRFLKELGSQMRLELVDSPDVCYRAGHEIHCVTRAQFAVLAEQGQVHDMTEVFDNTIGRVNDLDRWRVPAARSWHGRAFDLKAAVA